MQLPHDPVPYPFPWLVGLNAEPLVLVNNNKWRLPRSENNFLHRKQFRGPCKCICGKTWRKNQYWFSLRAWTATSSWPWHVHGLSENASLLVFSPCRRRLSAGLIPFLEDLQLPMHFPPHSRWKSTWLGQQGRYRNDVVQCTAFQQPWLSTSQIRLAYGAQNCTISSDILPGPRWQAANK